MSPAEDLSTQIYKLTASIAGEHDATARGDLLFRRGRLRWKAGDRGGAMSDYAKAAELAPGCGASEALEQSREIMAFYHRDLYNP